MKNSEAEDKKFLFLVFPGPHYDLADAFEARLNELSRYFEGVVLTRKPEATTLQYGDFSVVATSITGTGGIRSTIEFFLRGIALSLRWRSKRRAVDLVVTYSPLKIGLFGLVFARITGARLVTEVNGDHSAWANYADVKNPLVRRLKRHLNIMMETFVLKRAHGIKLLYAEQIDHLRPALAGKVIRPFADYVNLSSFRNLAEDKIVLLAGFPFFVKGVDILVSAFKRVAPGYPDWRLKILGWYPDPTELDACIAGHPQVFHHEAVHHRDMPQHIGSCAIFVLPSRTEAMGRVLLEAMAAGKPRIGAKVGGIPTVIEHGVDGLLFEPEDVDGLAQLLGELMGDPDLRKSLGRAGQQRVARDFSMASHCARTADFYHQVLDLPLSSPSEA